MKHQIDLGRGFGGFADLQAEWMDRIIDEVRAVADYHSHKVVAAALGMKKPSFSQAISQDPASRNGHRLPLDSLTWLVPHAPDSGLVDTIADMRREPATPEEQLDAMGEAARELFGPDVHRVLMAKARQRLARNRGRGR